MSNENSGELYKICSSDTKKQLRLIDIVTVKGSIQPLRNYFVSNSSNILELYTCDVDASNLGINKQELDLEKLTNLERKKARVLARNKRNDLRSQAFSG